MQQAAARPDVPPVWSLGITFSPQVRPPAADAAADAPITFAGVAYGGGLIPNYGWLGDVAIDLGTLRNSGAQVPALIDHEARVDSIAGRCTLELRTAPDGAQSLHVSGSLTRATPAGQRMAALLAERYPIQMSLGMNARLREVSPEDGPQRLNGRSLPVAHVFEHATIREVSFVPTGADSSTSAEQASFASAEGDDSAFSFCATPQPQFSTPTPPKQGQPTGATMARSQEDQALLDQQAATIAKLEADIKAAQQVGRRAAFGALCTELGRELPADDKLAPYLEMSEAAFAAYAADQRDLAAKLGQGRRGVDPALFSVQSSQQAGRRPADGTGNGAALLSAVKGLART